jgi:hypothetical protein
MFTRTNIPRAVVAITALVVTWAILGTAVAQRAAVPKPQDKLGSESPRSSSCYSLWIPTRTARKSG